MEENPTALGIVDTAIDLFWKSSYHATNMNALSRAAGVNKATVYQHFASKEEIAIASVKRAADRTIDYVFEGAFEAFEAPLDRLDNIYQRIYQSHKALFDEDDLARGCPFVNIGVELSTASAPVRKAVQQAFARFEAYYVRIVDDLRASGALIHDTTSQELARDLQANMNATLVASKIEKRPEAILDGGKRAARYLTG